MVGRVIDEGTPPRRPASTPTTRSSSTCRGCRPAACSRTSRSSCTGARSSASPASWAPGAPRPRARSSAPTTATAATIAIGGRQVRIAQPADAVKHGVGYLSEDRKLLGLMLEQDVTFNTVLASLGSYANGIGWMGDSKAKNRTKEYVAAAAGQDALGEPDREAPLRRQPAEGRHRPVADARLRHPHLRRADPRHRRRRQGRDLPPDAAARGRRASPSSSSRRNCRRSSASRTASRSSRTDASPAPSATRKPARRRSCNSQPTGRKTDEHPAAVRVVDDDDHPDRRSTRTPTSATSAGSSSVSSSSRWPSAR